MIRFLLLCVLLIPVFGKAQDSLPEPFSCEGLTMQETWQGVNYCVVLANPDGAVPEKGNTIYVHYVGYLDDGTVFDSSHKLGRPFSFRLDKMQVIRGWDIVFAKLREGEKARVQIPWKLGYGKYGNLPTIPRKANLTFDVELVRIVK